MLFDPYLHLTMVWVPLGIINLYFIAPTTEYIISADAFSVWTPIHISPKLWWALLHSESFQWGTWKTGNLPDYQSQCLETCLQKQLLIREKVMPALFDEFKWTKHLCEIPSPLSN